MTFNNPVNLQRKHSDILVVHCSDPRFQDAYRSLVDGLGKYYDLLVLPGACKAIAGSQSAVENIVMLHGLHHFKSIQIFDHVECGAFGNVENERHAHKQMMDKAKQSLGKVLPEVEVVGHLVREKEAVLI